MAADIVVVPTEVFPRTAADYIARIFGAGSRDAPHFSVALSGGRGPRPVYELLARDGAIPWQKIDLFFADERAVPLDDEGSNYRLVMETLGPCFSHRPEAIHRMEADRADLAGAASEYAALLPPALDLLVLGMGEDGHTASLFPGHAAVNERRWVVAVHGPATPPWRITITPPVIRAAKAIVMLVSGAAKAPAVARALGDPVDPAQCPAQLAREGTWILDNPAAALLGARAPEGLTS